MLAYEEQIDALAALVEDWAVKTDRNVKGQFTSGDYVTYRLNQIFTPAHWSFTILDGPTLVTISEKLAYAQVVGRLAVRFSDGSEAHQDDIGIWPFVATKAREGKTLDETAPERYETVLKAARTDCLKNAARNLGTCFAPLPQSSLELLAHIKRQAHLRSVQAEPERSAAQDTAELFGDAEPPQKPPGEESAGKTGKKATDSATETPQEAARNGLEKLLEDVNAALIKKALDTYGSVEDLTDALKMLSYSSYKPTLHDVMVKHLVACKMPSPETSVADDCLSMRDKLVAAADAGNPGPMSTKQFNLLMIILKETFGEDDKEQKLFLCWTFGYPTEGFSRKNLSQAQASAFLDELKLTLEGEKYVPTKPEVADLYRQMLRQAKLAHGQADMFDDEIPF